MDSVCPVKIEMDFCTQQASLPENSETQRDEFTELKIDFGRFNLNFSSAQTFVKSASTPVDGFVEKQVEDQVCSPLLVHNAAVAAADDLNTTDFPGPKPIRECLCLLIRFVWKQEAQLLHIHFQLQWQ